MKELEHVAPHEIPAGLELTEPVPVPSFETVSVSVINVNCAVTDIAPVTETTQVPVPEQPPPDHPVKVDPVDGVAVKVTEVP